MCPTEILNYGRTVGEGGPELTGRGPVTVCRTVFRRPSS